MIIVHREALPEAESKWLDDAAESITNEEIEAVLGPQGVTEVWFWYGSGGYEGSGQMLAVTHEGWDVLNLGHCSCYGPLDAPRVTPMAPEVLRTAFSAEALDGVEPLFERAAMPGGET